MTLTNLNQNLNLRQNSNLIYNFTSSHKVKLQSDDFTPKLIPTLILNSFKCDSLGLFRLAMGGFQRMWVAPSQPRAQHHSPNEHEWVEHYKPFRLWLPYVYKLFVLISQPSESHRDHQTHWTQSNTNNHSRVRLLNYSSNPTRLVWLR